MNGWDGCMYYSRWLGYPVFSCTSSGYVKDIWLNRKTSGILNYYDEVEIMKPGDIAVFKETNVTPYSHIAIFDSDAGNGYGNFLGQNQGAAGGAFSITTLPYSATYTTAFRPKCFTGSPTPSEEKTNTKKVNGYTVTLENGTATFTTGPINVRDGGPNGKVVAQYEKGQSVNYWGKWVGNGHRYVVYTSYSGATRFVAVSDSEIHGKDKWADCKTR